MSKDFHYTLRLPVSAKNVYEAVSTESGVRKWWTEFADVGHDTGSMAEFRFPKAGFYVKAEIQSLVPTKLVEWKVIDSMHPEKSGFSNLRDWEGTRFVLKSSTFQKMSRCCTLPIKGLRRNLNVIKFVRMDGSPIFLV